MPRRSSRPPAVPAGRARAGRTSAGRARAGRTSAGRARAGRTSAGRARAGRTSALDTGLRLLAVRSHSRDELRRKLGRRGYTDEDVELTVARLVELGYLDDASFAAGHVRRRSVTRGPLALAAELAARGVDREVARQAVAGLSQAAQLAAAVRLVARQGGRKGAASYKELLDSAGTKLLRRGFSLSIAREACWTVWQGTLDTSEP